MTFYDDLGVAKNADKATIKRTYRKRAQKEHPDKGGNAEKFHQIQRAYDVLGDDARRAHYDAYGVDGQRDQQNVIAQRLAALLMHLVESVDVDHIDLIGAMRDALVKGRQTTLAAIQVQEAKIKKYERAAKRMKRKVSGANVFAQMIEGQISIFKRGVELGKAELKTVEEMQEMLKDYQYQVDAGRAPTQMPWGPFGQSMFGQQA